MGTRAAIAATLTVITFVLAAAGGCSTTSRKATPTAVETPTEQASATPVSTTTATSTVSPTSTSTTTITITPAASPTFAATRYVYLGGGQTVNGSTAAAYSTWLGTGAMGSTWVTGASLPVPIGANSLLWSSNYLVSGGGYLYGPAGTPTPMYPYVFSAGASAGVIGAWSSQAALPTPAAFGGITTDSSYLYFAGGFNSWSSIVSGSYSATLSAGAVGSWTSGTPLTDSRGAASFERLASVWYCLGGLSSGSGAKVQSATLSSGSIGAWTTDVPLPSGRSYTESAIWGNYVYVIGGWGGSTLQSTVYYRPLGSNIPWMTAAPYPVPLNGAAAFAFNGYLYVLGGQLNTGFTSTIRAAPILADYSLGGWTAVSGLPTAYAWFSAAVGD